MDQKKLVPDFVAGLTTGIANIPDAMASAILAGVNPVFGLYALMVCTPVGALLISDDDHPECAIELYSLVQGFGHITNSRWFEEVACQELDEVRSSLPPEVASAGQASGRELNVWQTANDLLEEYSTKT